MWDEDFSIGVGALHPDFLYTNRSVRAFRCSMRIVFKWQVGRHVQRRPRARHPKHRFKQELQIARSARDDKTVEKGGGHEERILWTSN
jgi:hypothetical protein